MNPVLVLLAAINPLAVAAVLGGRVDRRVLAAGLALTAALATILATASEPLLDLLSVTPPTFQVATGAVLLAVALRWLAFGPRLLAPEERLLESDDANSWHDLPVPVLIPVLVSPQLIMTSISEGASDGTLSTATAAALALTVAGATTVLHRGRSGLWSAAVRVSAFLTAAIAAGLITDAIRTV